MKVNTDGVLLGALMTVRASDRMSLDVGTGTGTIALMAAQRLSGLLPDSGITPGSPDDGGNGVRILAIDIDKPSADEAARNFSASPWPSMLESFHASLGEFRTMRQCTGFDHIFSNPPYYDMSLTAPDPRRNTARHTDSLSYRELVEFASAHLSLRRDVRPLPVPHRENQDYGPETACSCRSGIWYGTSCGYSPGRIAYYP